MIVLGLLSLKNASLGSRIRSALTVTLVAACFVVPWTIRNQMQLGRPVWATTHGGYTLLLANNPLLFDHFDQQGGSRGWDAEPFHLAWSQRWVDTEQSSLANSGGSPVDREYWYREFAAAEVVYRDELSDDDLAYAAARAEIARRPLTFAKGVLYRCAWFWAAWPYSPSFSVASFCIGCWYALWFIAAIGGVSSKRVRRLWRMWFPAAALLLTLTLIHSVFWGNMRMRAALMAPVYVVAVLPWKSPDPTADT